MRSHSLPDWERSTMYLTPFVYEFFLYNSLYQVDWPESLAKSEQILHTSDREPPRQKAFEDFLCKESLSFPHVVCLAFEELRKTDLQGNWTTIKPDSVNPSGNPSGNPSLITEERGKKFFKDLRELQNRLEHLDQKPTNQLHSEVFNYIAECRRFVYDVRCNIFHGRKTLAEAYEQVQNERIRVYYLFLNGLVSLFFEIMQQK
jgi:hypothetical protein